MNPGSARSPGSGSFLFADSAAEDAALREQTPPNSIALAHCTRTACGFARRRASPAMSGRRPEEGRANQKTGARVGTTGRNEQILAG